MMAGPGGELMRADGAATAAARPEHDGRALVVRVERIDLGFGAGLPRTPFLLERRLVHRRIERGEEIPIVMDRLLDEIARRRGKHRTPLLIVGVEQAPTAPALQCRGQL